MTGKYNTGGLQDTCVIKVSKSRRNQITTIGEKQSLKFINIDL